MKYVNVSPELQAKLNTLAIHKSYAFCYSCCKRAKFGICYRCGSDDLMREVPEVGVEWGTSWVIKHIIEAELQPIEITESFEQMLADCYDSTVKIGWLEWDLIDALKTLAPNDWRYAQQEFESQLLEDSDTYCSFDDGATLYNLHEVENLVSYISDVNNLFKGWLSVDNSSACAV